MTTTLVRLGNGSVLHHHRRESVLGKFAIARCGRRGRVTKIKAHTATAIERLTAIDGWLTCEDCRKAAGTA